MTLNAGISFYRGAIQLEGWKLLNNPRYSPVVDNAYELYNVRDDPSEEIDYKTVYPELFEEMKNIFEVILYLLYLNQSSSIGSRIQIAAIFCGKATIFLRNHHLRFVLCSNGQI
jgi:hypothetical protein